MSICSFLSQKKVFDEKLPEALKTAAEVILKQRGSVDFYICQSDAFSQVCFSALSSFEHTDLRVFQVLPQEEKTTFSEMPFGGVIEAPCSERELPRWLIEVSHDIISYVYPFFPGEENRLLQIARKKERRIEDVTFYDTHFFFKRYMAQLEEEDRLLMTALCAGESLKKVHEQLCLPLSYLRTRAEILFRKMEKAAEEKALFLERDAWRF